MKEIRCSYYTEGTFHLMEKKGQQYLAEDGKLSVRLEKTEEGWNYEMEADCDYETQVRLMVESREKEEAFHVIPCTIYGDNHMDRVKKGEFPGLTSQWAGTRFCSPFWELRADRAAAPVSMMTDEEETVGIFIEPYCETEEGWIHNGLIAALPGSVGVSMGYINFPSTFVDKGNAKPSTSEYVKKAKVRGSIYSVKGNGRQGMHEIVRKVYGRLHERAVYHKSPEEAAKAILKTCVELNWNEEWQAYTDMSCCPPEKTELKAWRPVYEVGWTGIAEIAGPMLMAQEIFDLPDSIFGKAKNGYQLFDQIAGAYNEKSGLFNDLVAPVDESGSLVNGWWAWYYLDGNCHCAYTVGKAAYEMLKMIVFLKNRGKEVPEKWLEVSEKVLNTMVLLQREDGNYGYTYSPTEKKVLDWEGFAGCWFLPAMVYAYQLTGKEEYMDSARRAENFYRTYVRELNCYSTPMDTWKAVDEEGNLAFVRGTRLLHELTGERQYLEDLEAGVDFEYLWRYAYPARPENPPIKEGWNSCGGSVTSISNPHIHPMGVLIDDDLRYLAEATGDVYHRERAEDGLAWLMQCLELYPEKAGYGRYGMVSERFCPSDGLVTERYSDGRPYSSWFTFNLWATGNVMEAIMDNIIREGKTPL